MALKRFLETGEIVNTHGVKGEVRVLPWSDSPAFLTRFDRLYLREGSEALEVESARVHKSYVIVKFRGVDDMSAAARLVKSVLYIDRAWVSLPEGSYFYQDLIGLAVVNRDSGRLYGTLSDVFKTGANDVYSVTTGEGEVLVPVIPQVIREVDPEGGRILITPLKGLFSDED